MARAATLWARLALAGAAVGAVVGILGGCAMLAPPVPLPPREAPALDAPATWPAPPIPPSATPAATRQPLPEGWTQFDDPLLLDLLAAAQAASPDLAAARARIEQARASSVAAGALLLPTLDANGSASTGRAETGLPRASFATVNLQASWELDLFGANRAGSDAALAQLLGAQASAAALRIAVAAETASSYNALRGCEAVVLRTEADARSRAETARLTDLVAQAGLSAPATAALARASAAQGRSLLAGQKAQCELLFKSLVELTALDDAALRQRLQPGHALLPTSAAIAVPSVPGAALMQRADLLAAAQQVVAAAAQTEQAQARRYPRVAIGGLIGPAWMRVESVSADATLWTIGPLQVSLPLFDGGTRAANVVAERARYDAAVSAYRAAVRTALREVQAALITLDATTRRIADTQASIEGFEASLRAADARFRAGLGSLFDLEDARRSALVAQSTLVELQREQVAAWINLYRALGGGFSRATDLAAAGGAPIR